MDLAGRPLLAQILRRVAAARHLDEVVVATSVAPGDDAVESLATAAGLRCIRGSEDDVLGRFVDAAREAAAEVVIRITGDCPLTDPNVVDSVVKALLQGSEPADYASNVLRRTFPRGLDVEAMHFDVLARMARLGVSRGAREHVTWFARKERPDLFVLRSVEHTIDLSHLDWSVDTETDLTEVRRIYELAGLGERLVPWTDVAEVSGRSS